MPTADPEDPELEPLPDPDEEAESDAPGGDELDVESYVLEFGE